MRQELERIRLWFRSEFGVGLVEDLMMIRVVIELTWQHREFAYLLWVSFHPFLNI